MADSVIQIWLPQDAPESEREAFLDHVADAVHNFEPRTAWDPQVIATLSPGGSDAEEKQVTSSSSDPASVD